MIQWTRILLAIQGKWVSSQKKIIIIGYRLEEVSLKKKKESECLCSTKMKDITKRKAENQGIVLDSTVERGTGNTMMPPMQEDSRTVSLA